MAPDKQRKAARDEFAADSPKGRRAASPQQAPLKRVDEAADSVSTATAHGDEPSAESYAQPPREDRAG